MKNRLEESKRFINAFRNEEVKPFLRTFLISNYTDAVCTYHPSAQTLDRNFIEQKNSELIGFVFDAIHNLKDHPSQLFNLFHELSRNNPNRNTIWFQEYIDAYTNYKHHRKLENRYNQLSPYFKGESYCDVGCGGGDLVAYFLKNHAEFKQAAGIDIMDWRTSEVKDLIDFQMLDLSKDTVRSKEQYDTLTCIAVLHHTGPEPEDIKRFLNNLHSAMKPGSRLIIEEDVIIPDSDQNLNREISSQLATLIPRQKFLNQFLSMDERIQRDIIIGIDFLGNCLSVGVPDMPFPCGFQTLSNWLSIFNETNYKLIEVSIQGFVQNNFNQSFHVFFILEN